MYTKNIYIIKSNIYIYIYIYICIYIGASIKIRMILRTSVNVKYFLSSKLHRTFYQGKKRYEYDKMFYEALK